MRAVELKRTTAETDISLKLNLDGTGKSAIRTGCGFLDHMLTLFAFHGSFDLEIEGKGDTHVDDHHTVEDVGIVLGQAFAEALGNKAGIGRYGSFTLVMDEALILSAIDIGGRCQVGNHLRIPTEKVGTFDTELVSEFLWAFARNLQAAVHVYQICGENSHHIIEGMFKGLGRAVKQAVAVDPALAGRVASTKGSL
ncbi:MAG: imidazoleglycerol-phosphate dehydratase HisB [Clostridiales bacterium]|nr:imidazoleglycerol-phosphate dehydratase HisB [Clostridiales bacterium]